jgi:hypothetical protein
MYVHFYHKLGLFPSHTPKGESIGCHSRFPRVFWISGNTYNNKYICNVTGFDLKIKWTYPSLRHSLVFSSAKSDTSGILSGVLPDPDTSGMLISNPCESADGFDWARLLRASTSVWINFVPGLAELVGWYSPCEAWSSAAPWSWAMGGGGRLGPNPCIKTCLEGTVPIIIRPYNYFEIHRINIYHYQDSRTLYITNTQTVKTSAISRIFQNFQWFLYWANFCLHLVFNL